MEARCQCGAVSFKTPTPKPLAVYVCHCGECRRQTGSAFGTSAIFPRFKLPESEWLSCYARPTPGGPSLYCYFCRNCGTRLLHSTPTKNVVSVKGGCIEGLDWSKAVHIWTKNAMVPIPEEAETHSEYSDHTEYSNEAMSSGSSCATSPPMNELDEPGELAGSGSCHVSDSQAIKLKWNQNQRNQTFGPGKGLQEQDEGGAGEK